MLRNKLRILVVDDAAEYRDYLCHVIESDAMLSVVGSCGVGDGAGFMRRLVPDVIALEPGAEGTELFERAKALLAETKIPVVIITAFPDTRQAMPGLGAVDFLEKPGSGAGLALERFELLVKLGLKTHAAASEALPHPARPKPATLPCEGERERIIVMGASLGGTEVILRILRELPATLPGIVIVQHMPPGFTGAYAKRLDESSAISVREAGDGDRVLSGTALVAPGGRQLRVRACGNGFSVTLGESEKHGGFCPSVDVLFRSAAIAGKNAVAVILTGMGHDGAEGIACMHRCGAHTMGQDRESCAVFGMPAAAEALGGIDEMLSVEEIIRTLSRLQ